MDSKQLKKIYLTKLSNIFNRAFLPPDYVGISLTKRCNLKCKMCDIRKYPTTPEGELTLSEIKKIVDDSVEWGVKNLTLTGGEPLLRTDFFPIAQYALNRFEHTCINTNLTLINEDIADKIATLPEGKFHLAVSIDGSKSATHDSIRGVEGAFNRIMKGVKLIREASSKRGVEVKIGASFVLMEENLKETLELVLLTKELGFINVSVMPIMPNNVDLKDKENLVIFNEYSLKYLDKLIEELILFKQKHGLLINQDGALKLYRDYFRGKLNMTKGICHAGYLGPNVVETGETYICNQSIGNIKDRSIKELWRSERANKIRKHNKYCPKPCLQHFSIPWEDMSLMSATAKFVGKKVDKWI